MLKLLQQLSALTDAPTRRRAAGLFVAMFVGALLEAIGIGMVFPFLALLADSKSLERGWLAEIYRASETSPHGFFVLLAAALMAAFVAKNIYLAILIHVEHRFALGSQVALSRRLYRHYLTRPYSFHLGRNSAELQRNVNTETLSAFSFVTLPLLGVASELLVVALVSLVLLVVSPLLSLMILAFVGGVGGAFLLLIRRRTARLGAEQQRLYALMLRWVNQGLGSIREVKVGRTENFFLDRYTAASQGYADANSYLKTVSAMPRLVIETLGVLTLLGASLAMMDHGVVGTLIPKLGVFGLAAMRLMPSLNRIVSSLTSIRFYQASIDVLYEDLIAKPGADPPPLGSGTSLPFEQLRVDEVSYWFDGAEKPALDSVSIDIPKGAFVGLIGASGAGKTTLLAVMLGLLPPSQGRLLVDGQDVAPKLGAWQAQLGYIPQAVYLLDDTIRANIAFGETGRIDDAQVWRALEAAQLDGFVRSLPAGLDTQIGENGARLSGGQRQRIGIARALYRDPPVLVLDEATSALDPETEREFLKVVLGLRGERTLLMVTHRIESVRDCDLVCIMAGGKVVASGRFEALAATAAMRDLSSSQATMAAVGET